MGEIATEIFRQFSQVFPLLARPVMQQLHTRFSDGFKRLFYHWISRLISPASPAHPNFPSLAEPR